jgi:hypothetical protein
MLLHARPSCAARRIAPQPDKSIGGVSCVVCREKSEPRLVAAAALQACLSPPPAHTTTIKYEQAR